MKSSTLGLSPTGFGRGCQCAKGTQDTESSVSNDTLKPNGVQCAKGTQDTESSISNDTLKPNGALITSANKETKRKLHAIF